jgi:hypothetical protein
VRSAIPLEWHDTGHFHGRDLTPVSFAAFGVWACVDSFAVEGRVAEATKCHMYLKTLRSLVPRDRDRANRGHRSLAAGARLQMNR